MVTVTLVSLVAALTDMVGGWLTLRLESAQAEMERLMAISTGFVLGTALLLMLPRAMQDSSGAVMTAAGFVGLLLFRSIGVRLTNRRSGLGGEAAWAVLLAMAMHGLVEGVALGLAVQAGGRIGLLALLGIMLHKLPEGFSVATVFLSAGHSGNRAMKAATAVGLATVLGGWAALLGAGGALFPQGAVLGVAAGSFLYVGSTEMLPHLLRRGGPVWLVLVGLMLVMLLVSGEGFGHSH